MVKLKNAKNEVPTSSGFSTYVKMFPTAVDIFNYVKIISWLRLSISNGSFQLRMDLSNYPNFRTF